MTPLSNLGKIKYKDIGFSGALSMISTNVSIIVAISIYLNLDASVPSKIIAVMTLYTIIALLSEELRDLQPLATRTYDILTNPQMPATSKQVLIKQLMEDAVKQWVKVFTLWELIVNTKKETLKTKLERLEDLLKKIPNGHMSVYQLIVIYGYFGWNILAIKQGWMFDWWIDAIIISGLAIVMIIMSSSMIGILKFFEAVFKCLVPKTEKEIQVQLDLLQMFIIEGIHVYYEIDLTKYPQVSNGLVKTPALQPCIKVAPKGEVFTPEQIEKNNLKELSVSLCEAKKEVNGKLKAMENVKDI